MEFRLETQNYNKFFWVSQKTDREGNVIIYKDTNIIFQQSYTIADPWYDEVSLEMASKYTISLNNIQICFAYLYNDNMTPENSICYLEFKAGIVEYYTDANVSSIYAQPLRNQFHFSTLKNWMNDPNGLCKYKGLYHMFYQMNPAGINWGNMYCGHAVSSDLLYWRHLPIALFPQKELYGNFLYKGGAYSGSALPEKDKIHLYFTRHFSPWKKGPETKEVQVHAISVDGIKVKNETVIIEKKPGGDLDFNFRDPKIVVFKGRKNLLIATTVNQICTIERYELEDTGWKDKGAFFQDNIDCDTMECVNLIKGDGNIYAILCSLQNARDDFGRKRLMKYYIGFIREGQFIAIKSDIYDFGTECYAAQTFEAEGRTLSFGWVLSAYDEFKESGNISQGCMTIPRELYLRGNTLYTIPAQEIKQLLIKTVRVIDGGKWIHNKNITGQQYHVWIELAESTDFLIILAYFHQKRIGLEYKEHILRIIHGKEDSQGPYLFQKVEKINTVEIFVDRSVIEVFVNGGEFVGTKTYFFESENKRAEFFFDKITAVKRLEVSEVKTIWKLNEEESLK